MRFPFFESSEASADDNLKYGEEYGYTHFRRTVTALKTFVFESQNHRSNCHFVLLSVYVYMKGSFEHVDV